MAEIVIDKIAKVCNIKKTLYETNEENMIILKVGYRERFQTL